MTTHSRRQGGFAYIAAVLILVALSTLAITVSRLNSSQASTSAQDALQAHALQAARAGTEWGLYQALTLGNACAAATLNFADVSGFRVTVTCNRSAAYGEGLDGNGLPRSVFIYTIDAVACNAAVCPDNASATGRDYVERRRVLSVCVVGPIAAPATPCP